MTARGPRHIAMMEGSKFYFTNIPCKRGHVAERSTVDGKCVDCRREDDKSYYHANPEKARQKARSYNECNREVVAEKARIYRSKMNDDQKAAARERAKIKSREWRKLNPGHRNALKRKYTADKGNRTPSWADIDAIIDFYKKCPKGYHVDHIIPLRGKFVSGLHILINLQYLSAEENMRKNNRFDVL